MSQSERNPAMFGADDLLKITLADGTVLWTREDVERYIAEQAAMQKSTASTPQIILRKPPGA